MFSVPSLPRAFKGRRRPSTLSKLQVLRVLDHFFAGSQLHIRFLPVAPETFGTPAAAKFSVINRGTHAVYLHFKNSLDRFLDFRFRGVPDDLEHDRMLRLLHPESLFCDDRTPDNLIKPRRHELFPF